MRIVLSLLFSILLISVVYAGTTVQQTDPNELNAKVYQGGTWFTNITGVNGAVRSRQLGTWFSNISGINGSVRARQSGTWFSNITGVNGSVRARQSGTWNVRQRNYTSFLNTTKPYQSSLTTAFSNNTTGAGSSINLGHLIPSHTWSIKSTKKTADINWIITLDGSLDNIDFESLDTFSTRTSFNLRHIVNKPVEYIRARVVQRGYTGIRPTITIKTKSGGN